MKQNRSLIPKCSHCIMINLTFSIMACVPITRFHQLILTHLLRRKKNPTSISNDALEFHHSMSFKTVYTLMSCLIYNFNLGLHWKLQLQVICTQRIHLGVSEAQTQYDWSWTVALPCLLQCNWVSKRCHHKSKRCSSWKSENPLWPVPLHVQFRTKSCGSWFKHTREWYTALHHLCHQVVCVCVCLCVCVCVCVCVLVAQLCPTLWGPMDCSLPGSSVHGILEARLLEWVAGPSSMGSSWSRYWTWVFCTAGRFFTIWDTISITRAF